MSVESESGEAVEAVEAGGAVERAKGPGGRPSTYDPAIIETVCELVATSDIGLHHVLAARDDLPAESTIYKWLLQHAEFAEQYAHARTRQGLRQGDKAVEEALLAEDAALGRLRYDARRWQASKLASKVYGDRIAHTNAAGDGDARIEVVTLADELAGLINVTPRPKPVEALPAPGAAKD
jgi:hypothetical protein